jgi:gamma-F420-2:alpha-L-glutamate ligase
LHSEVVKLKGWILYKDSANHLKPETYEIHRFVEIAKEEGIDLLVVQPEQLDLTVTREDKRSILLESEPVELPDFILPRMGAGTTYFALAIIRHLERLGVYSVNSSQSIETVKDKLYTHQILAENNLPVPKTMLVKFPINADLVEKNIGFPVIVKTLSGTQGSGVFLSESKSSFKDLMQLIEATNKTANIILQEFISASKGRDLRVITIGCRVVACMQRIAQEGEFKANYSIGGKVEQYEVTPEIEWLATQTSQLLNLDIAGIDLLFDKDHFKVCEANSSTGFEGIESCCDINVPKEIYHFIRIRRGLFNKTPNTD